MAGGTNVANLPCRIERVRESGDPSYVELLAIDEAMNRRYYTVQRSLAAMVPVWQARGYQFMFKDHEPADIIVAIRNPQGKSVSWSQALSPDLPVPEKPVERIDDGLDWLA